MNSQPIFENGNLRIKRCRHGAMMYLVSDVFVGRSFDLYGEYCEGEMSLLKQIARPGMVIVEVGANIGAHTIPLANAVGPDGIVIAVEPQRFIHQILSANLALNRIAHVRALHSAMGRENGSIIVPNVDYDKTGNYGGLSLGHWQNGERVRILTLDSLSLNRCDFIKIDAEGMESDVLHGAQDTIGRYKPVLYVENDRKDKSADLITWLFTHDYRLYWHLPRLFHPGNFFGDTQNAFGTLCSVNMLCVHRSSGAAVRDLREISSPDVDWRMIP